MVAVKHFAKNSLCTIMARFVAVYWHQLVFFLCFNFFPCFLFVYYTRSFDDFATNSLLHLFVASME